MQFSKITKVLLFSFTFLLFSITLSSCNQKNPTSKDRVFVEGALFGAYDGQKVLLSSSDSSVIQTDKIKDGFYRFELKPEQIKKRPFSITYTFDATPTPDPKPPFIRTQVSPTGSILLPALLVFKFNLQLKDKSKDSITFKWNKPVFSQANDSQIYINTTLEDGFPSKKYIINTKKVSIDETQAEIKLDSKMKGKDSSLKERLKKHCKESKWNLALPYKYPEGIQVVYVSNQVVADICND